MRVVVGSALVMALVCGRAVAQQPRQVFDQACTTCHGNPEVSRAPLPSTLRTLPPERIYSALTAGVMRAQGESLPDEMKRGLAEYLSDRRLSSEDLADAKTMPNRCANPQGPVSVAGPSWNGWGVDLANTRLQPQSAAGLSAGDLPNLKVKWAFGIPGAAAMYGQPAVVGGRLFFGTDIGYVYSLDALTGCVHWSFQAQAGVRTMVTVGMLATPARTLVYFGDLRGNAYALDASTGALIWKVSADNHSIARITGSPVLHNNRLYVPVASSEESSAAFLNYPCCTFRGSVVALDAATGEQIWKTYMIPAEPARRSTNARGVELWGPAGAAVWGTPAIDAEQNAIYVSTGNGYTFPAEGTTNSIVALDMDTGRARWLVQDLPNDSWIAACASSDPAVKPPENCPAAMGPDYDFSSSVILKKLADGSRVLIAGQKSGIVWAHDPDNNGALLWKTTVARATPNPTGELVWGGAADDGKAYFGLNSGGVVALNLDGGQPEWLKPLDPAAERGRGNSSALGMTPEFLVSTGWDGVIRALSPEDGNVLWQFDTVRDFETVNNVAARGGSMGAQGATVADGMMFVGSGYIGFQNGLPGNVLLALSPD